MSINQRIAFGPGMNVDGFEFTLCPDEPDALLRTDVTPAWLGESVSYYVIQHSGNEDGPTQLDMDCLLAFLHEANGPQIWKFLDTCTRDHFTTRLSQTSELDQPVDSPATVSEVLALPEEKRRERFRISQVMALCKEEGKAAFSMSFCTGWLDLSDKLVATLAFKKRDIITINLMLYQVCTGADPGDFDVLDMKTSKRKSLSDLPVD